jgi:polysaccharide export outer membrane protein
MSRLHFFLLCGVLAGCASLALAEDTFADRNPPYRLQSGDTIQVEYRYTPEYNATVVIQPGGSVNLPMAGDIKLQGLTIPEAQSAIADQASERLNHPEVAVLLKDYVHPYFVVSGEVNHPGRFEMRGDVTAFEAIAMGGGFKDSSKHSQVLLVRKYNRDMAEVTVLNMKAMSHKSEIAEDPLLRPGDMLLVPQNTVSKLERFVRWTSVAMLGLTLVP